MRFKVSKNQFRNAVKMAIKAVTHTPQLLILSGLHIEAFADGRVSVTGNGVSVIAKAWIDNVDVKEPGSAIVNAQMLNRMVQTISEDLIEIFTDDDNKSTVIKYGRSRLKLNTIEGVFPTYMDFNPDYSIEMDGSVLADMFNKVVAFASDENTHLASCAGVSFKVDGGVVELAGTDTRRLACVKQVIDDTEETFSVVLPTNGIKLFLGNKDEEWFTIETDLRTIRFRSKTCQIYMSLLDGTFMSYDKVLNVSPRITATMDKGELTNAVSRAMLMSGMAFGPDKPPVVMDVYNHKVLIMCRASNGTYSEELSADIDGEDIKIGFNCIYLYDVISRCDNDTVTLELTEPLKAALVHDNGATYLTMPMRLLT